MKYLFVSIVFIILLYINGFSECISGNCTNGTGELNLEEGRYYKGSFKNGKPHGKGISVTPNGGKYIGEYNEGIPHGQGELYFPNGDKYIGIFNNFDFSKGTYFWSDGRKFVGDFVNRTMHGKGEHFWPDGGKFKGYFINGLRYKKGEMLMLNGEKYIGNWHTDSRHGQGTQFDKNGKVTYNGLWINNVFSQIGGPTHIIYDDNNLMKENSYTILFEIKTTGRYEGYCSNQKNVYPKNKINNTFNKTKIELLRIIIIDSNNNIYDRIPNFNITEYEHTDTDQAFIISTVLNQYSVSVNINRFLLKETKAVPTIIIPKLNSEQPLIVKWDY